MEQEKLKQRFIAIYQAESDAVFRYCFFRISSRENALDLTQDTFTKFWDALVRHTEIRNDRAFIFMIAHNLVIDFYRKKKSLSLDEILDENGEGMFMAGEGATKEGVEMSVEARFVMDKISELEPIHRQTVYLRFVEGLEPRDISQVLGISANAVSVRIIRAMEKLRELTGYEKKNKQKDGGE